jgi:hypothetical protein
MKYVIAVIWRSHVEPGNPLREVKIAAKAAGDCISGIMHLGGQFP